MFHIGGEIHFKKDELFSYVTDSGRSSLRLILKSGLNKKKFILPDYLCKVILWIFDEFQVNYSFYKVNKDLSIDEESLKDKDFEVLYIINYFGNINQKPVTKIDKNILIIEDCVFLPLVEKPKDVSNWIGYNSFRKISYLADGSILKSTVELNSEFIIKKEALFSKLKYKAKQIKSDYLTQDMYSEKEYLNLFEEAEGLVDNQKEIYSISNQSLFNLFDFYKNSEKEYLTRKKNYAILDRYLNKYKVKLHAEHYTLYVLFIKKRNELKKYLFTQNIFLPVHWPATDGLKNNLYDCIISVPVDSRYNESDMEKVALLICDFLNNTGESSLI